MISKKINQRISLSFYLLIILYLTSCSVISKKYTAGSSYLNESKYVEYLPGTLPIVISVPHGGYLMPDTIPDRDCDNCVYVRDSYTQELARSIRDNFFKETGNYPHMVINLLNRKKFDANRDKADAADGNKTVEKAWSDYHQFINIAKAQIDKDFEKGLFIDLHGHGHKLQRIELGYFLVKDELQLTDSILNTEEYVNKSSIKNLVNSNLNNLSHSQLLRGNNSLGTF